jgi:hypothetical protein
MFKVLKCLIAHKGKKKILTDEIIHMNYACNDIFKGMEWL